VRGMFAGNAAASTGIAGDSRAGGEFVISGSGRRCRRPIVQDPFSGYNPQPMSERTRGSEYMRWAKENHASVRFNLAVSGIPSLTLADLGARIEDLELTGPDGYGYAPLVQALAAHCAVPEESVVAATGTSMANHLVLAALLDPGDEVAIELPGYGPLVDAAEYLGTRVRRFPRRREDGFAVDPDLVRQALTPRTRLIVLTNLHNPSAALTGEDTLREIGALAERVGARVLVDEVYLDAAFEDAPRSAFHLVGPFVTTSSLTKVYGLSGLRCGFILAPKELARRIWLLNDLFGVNAAHAAERLSVIALSRLPELAARSRALLDANRPILNLFLETCRHVEAPPSARGTTAFPRLLAGSVDRLETLLREKYEASVSPGRFFGAPDHFRVGISCPTPILEAGLERLASAIAELARERREG